MHESQMADGGIFEMASRQDGDGFVSPDKFEVVSFAPSAALAPFVTHIYFFRCEEAHIRDIKPAALGQLLFFLKGKGSFHYQDGRVDQVSTTAVFGPGTTAAEFTFAGPLHNFGFALSSLGFVALTGKPANMFNDRAVPAAELFGAEIDLLADSFSSGHANGTFRFADMVQQTTAFLLRRLRPVPKPHAAMVQTVVDWLSSDLEPDVENLYRQIHMSRSTTARLITRYFGSPPKPLMRKYRALRAASMLVSLDCTPELRAKVESLFYDQPHMIREIRHFTGRTPGALDGDDAEILRIWLGKSNYRDIESFPG